MPIFTTLLRATIFVCALLFLSESEGYCARDVDAPAAGKIIRYRIATTLVRPYKLGQQWRSVIVYTPPGYDAPENARRRYPVFYLLHGSPGKPIDFVHNGHWPDLMQMLPGNMHLADAILIMPDGNYDGAVFGDSEWINSADNRDLFEDFVTKQIVGWADANLRTIPTPDGRVIGGVSEGGYGSLNIALHHPEVFHNVVALSGYFRNDGSGWARKIMGRTQTFLNHNSPLDYVEDVSGSDPRMPQWRQMRIYLGAGAEEKRYLIESREMAAELNAENIPTVLDIVPGKHGWGLWNALFVDSLTKLSGPINGLSHATMDSP